LLYPGPNLPIIIGLQDAAPIFKIGVEAGRNGDNIKGSVDLQGILDFKNGNISVN
jgi:hypothetical protein